MIRRTHPVTIFANIGRFLFLLLVPLVRSLFYIRSGFFAWLEGAWVDIIVLLFILALAVLRWWCIYYYFTPSAIHIHDGFLLVRTRSIPYQKLSSIYLEDPFWYRPFGAVTLRLDTDAGSVKSHDAILVLKKSAAVELLQMGGIRQSLESLTHQQIFMSRNLYVVILSLITTNYFAGVTFLSVFITKVGDILGEEIAGRVYGTLAHVAQLVALGIPPVAVFLAVLLLLGWAISFARNLIRYYNFCITRAPHRLFITGGIFVQREYSVLFNKIHFLDIQQTLFTKILGIYSAYIKCSGYGKSDDIRPVIIPAAGKKAYRQYLQKLVPEFLLSERTIGPNLFSIFKFIIDPLGLLLADPLLWWVLCKLLPSWESLITVVALLLLVPILWFLCLRVADFLQSGIGVQKDCYTLRYSKGFTLHTVVVHRDKIARVRCRQSIIQMGDDACDVFIYTYGEGLTRHHLKNLPRQEVCRLFGLDPRKRHRFSLKSLVREL